MPEPAPVTNAIFPFSSMGGVSLPFADMPTVGRGSWFRKEGRSLRLSEKRLLQSPFLRSVDGCKEQTGEEGKVIDEEAELGLVLLPMGRTVEGESQEDH